MTRIHATFIAGLLGLAIAAPVQAQNAGPERGRAAVHGSGSVSEPTLREAETRVPDEAKPAIRRSVEAGRQGRATALENIGRDADSGSPHRGAGAGGAHFGGGAGAAGGRGR